MMNIYSFRLNREQDLKLEIESFAKHRDIQAGFVITCVGSLSIATLRMAGASPEQQDIKHYRSHLEIVSLVGTIAVNGSHMHMSVSDENGRVIGGHLNEGSIVATTAEIVIGEDENTIFTRELDPTTGFSELVTKSRNN